MHLIHESTIKNIDGIIDVTIYIINDKIRKYTYYLTSSYAVEKFERLYKKGRGFHGVALKILKENMIKQGEKE